MRPSERIEELSEDIDVAIREFLERHPHTKARQVREAMLVAGPDACGRERRARRALAFVLVFLLGAGLGAVLF